MLYIHQNAFSDLSVKSVVGFVIRLVDNVLGPHILMFSWISVNSPTHSLYLSSSTSLTDSISSKAVS